MDGDQSESSRPGAGPVPPVRARLADEERVDQAPSEELPLLAPVHSGLFAAPAPATEPSTDATTQPAAVEPEPVGPEPVEQETPDVAAARIETTETPAAPITSDLTWYGDEEEMPWEEATPDVAEAGEEIVLDTAFVDTGEAEIVIDEAVDAPGEPADEDQPARPAAPPLSPWDLGAASPAVEDAETHAARARAEWESLGQALSESLSPGGREIELTDEIAARLEATGAWDHVRGETGGPAAPLRSGSPFTIRAEPPRGLADLAGRLEAFARKLRAEGGDALARAEKSGDRIDAILAALAAGFLAGRGE